MGFVAYSKTFTQSRILYNYNFGNIYQKSNEEEAWHFVEDILMSFVTNNLTFTEGAVMFFSESDLFIYYYNIMRNRYFFSSNLPTKIS